MSRVGYIIQIVQLCIDMNLVSRYKYQVFSRDNKQSPNKYGDVVSILLSTIKLCMYTINFEHNLPFFS